MIRPILLPALLLGAVLAMPLPADTGFAPAAAAKTRLKPAAIGAKDPEAVIRRIYGEYTKEAGPAEAEQETFSPELLQLWYDVQNAADAANEGGVDFDVFLDAQEVDVVTNITTRFTPDGKDKGSVDVVFTVFGKSETVHYAMVKTGQGWKIDNISWGPGRDDLRKTLTMIKSGQKPVQ